MRSSALAVTILILSLSLLAEAQPCINVTKTNDFNNSLIPNWTMNLYNSSGLVATGTTDDSGYWTVCDLEPGDYWVCEEAKSGWTNVTPICQDVTLGQVNETVDFRNRPILCISGYKIDNCTGKGISNWFIELNNATGKSTDGTHSAILSLATTGSVNWRGRAGRT